MKKLNKVFAAVLSLLVLASVIPQTVFAADRYDEVTSGQSIVGDAEVHVYATRNGGTVSLTGSNSVASTFPMGSGYRQYTAAAAEDWVWKGWSYEQIFNGKNIGNRTDSGWGTRYSFSNSGTDWNTAYNGTGETISVNRLFSTGETVANKLSYRIYANFNPTITASAGDGGSITDTGKTEVEYNLSKEYTVTAGPGKIIELVTVDGQNVAIDERLKTFTYKFTNVTEPHTINATFADVYSIFYAFSSATAGKNLPDEILDFLPMEETKKSGESVTPAAPGEDRVGVADGVWTFEGWSPDMVEDLTDDVLFIGKWKFSPYAAVINAAPVISAEDKTLTVGDTFDPMKDVTAKDDEDGDLTDKIEIVDNTVDTSKAGEYMVVYKVKDKDGASATKTIKVTVKDEDKDKDKEDDDQPIDPKKPENKDKGTAGNKSSKVNNTDNKNNKNNIKAPSKTAQSGKTVKSVNTGDNTNVVIWGGVLLLSLLISAAALFARRKKH